MISASDDSQQTSVDADGLVLRAETFARDRLAGSGKSLETALEHAAGTSATLSQIGADPVARAAAWLFAGEKQLPLKLLNQHFEPSLVAAVQAMRKLRALREIHRNQRDDRSRDAAQNLEILRRMLMAMSVDIRVVLLRLASRLQTLRSYAQRGDSPEVGMCHETLELLAPLANRLGLGQLKWELEDLAFRFLDQQTYHAIARGLAQKRVVRERFVADAIETIRSDLVKAKIHAELSGRPKHLYSVYKKMTAKNLELAQIYDLSAFRIIVDSVEDCYRVLDLLHQRWAPISSEYDDYISRPKANGYQSLHTIVVGPEQGPLEVQIRTTAMHEAAEYGVASHWRYKEGGASRSSDSGFDSHIAWLRQLLSWQSEVGAALGADAHSKPQQRVYALTPQGRVVDLPAGATAIDFAYRLHTDLGHRCRGARIDGQQAPLSTPLHTGQTVEIVSAKARAGQAQEDIGPSRDWLNPELAYLASSRAKTKVRQWFSAREASRDHAEGRAIVERVLQREGATSQSLDGLAELLMFASVDAMFSAVAHGDLGPRAIARAVNPSSDAEKPQKPNLPVHRPSKSTNAGGAGVLVGGVASLMTHLARCCKPVPPDPIEGYITRGKGVTIHRKTCHTLHQLQLRSAERIVVSSWGNDALTGASVPTYTVDISVQAQPRESLLNELADVLARQRVTLVDSKSSRRADEAMVRMSVLVADTTELAPLMSAIKRLPGIHSVRRR